MVVSLLSQGQIFSNLDNVLPAPVSYWNHTNGTVLKEDLHTD